MLISLLWTTLFMGLVGGPHCLVMCAAPCALVASGGASDQAVSRWRWLSFHVGRLLGYSALGALAAWAMGEMAWLASTTTWLRPVWTGMHLAILFWGGLMLLQGQQPRWLEAGGRAVWRKVQPLVTQPSGSCLAGMAWALLPCGLLYSAVLTAALAANPGFGALSMLAFGVGSGLWLWLAPLAWRLLQGTVGRWRSDWGTRAAGAMLVGVALWALWLDAVHGPELWCAT